MNEMQALATVQALSQESRLRIVGVLTEAGRDGLPVGPISGAVATPRTPPPRPIGAGRPRPRAPVRTLDRLRRRVRRGCRPDGEVLRRPHGTVRAATRAELFPGRALTRRRRCQRACRRDRTRWRRLCTDHRRTAGRHQHAQPVDPLVRLGQARKIRSAITPVRGERGLDCEASVRLVQYCIRDATRHGYRLELPAIRPWVVEPAALR